MKKETFPIQLFKAPRCTARRKRTLEPCKNPAVKGWNVCRMHGAKGGRPIITGLHTKEARKERAAVSQLLKNCKNGMEHCAQTSNQ